MMELIFTAPVFWTSGSPAAPKVAVPSGTVPPVQLAPIFQSVVAPFQVASVARAFVVRATPASIVADMSARRRADRLHQAAGEPDRRGALIVSRATAQA